LAFCAARDHTHFKPSLVAQRFHWIEPRGAICREEGKDAANEKCPDANDRHITRDHFRGDFRKLVNLSGKDFYLSCPREPLTELMSVTNERHAQTETSQGPKKTHDDALTKKDTNNLPDIGTNRFHDSDIARFLNGDRNECVHDPKGRYDND